MRTHLRTLASLSTLLLTLAGCGGSGDPAAADSAASDPAPVEPEPVTIVDNQLSVGDLTFDIRSSGPDDGELVLMRAAA